MTHEEACQAIAMILAQLETESGQLVEKIEIEHIDVTRLMSPGRLERRRIAITLAPKVGDWMT